MVGLFSALYVDGLLLGSVKIPDPGSKRRIALGDLQLPTLGRSPAISKVAALEVCEFFSKG